MCSYEFDVSCSVGHQIISVSFILSVWLSLLLCLLTYHPVSGGFQLSPVRQLSWFLLPKWQTIVCLFSCTAPNSAANSTRRATTSKRSAAQIHEHILTSAPQLCAETLRSVNASSSSTFKKYHNHDSLYSFRFDWSFIGFKLIIIHINY